MNVLGHTQVALATDDDPLYLLGSVLPDLASMAGVRIERTRLAGPLARGVRVHVQADAVFHSHPAFRRGFTGIRDDLLARGIRRGPARAVGHAGWELLLDGTLLGTPAEASFHHAMHHGERVLTAIAPAHQPRWRGFLGRWHRLPLPRLRYDDPAWVAERLHGMLSARSRLAFPRAQLPAVREVLTSHAPRVARCAEAVLTTVVAGAARS